MLLFLNACPSGSRGDDHLLMGFAAAMPADFDPYLPNKPHQKIEQIVHREAAEMPVHQVRDVGLRNAEQRSDLALLQFPVLEDFEDVVTDLGADQKLAGIFEAEIGEDIAAAASHRIAFGLVVLM